MKRADSARVFPETFSSELMRDIHAMNARVCRDLASDPHRRPRPGIDKSKEQLLAEAADHDAQARSAGPATLWFWRYSEPGVGSTQCGSWRTPEAAKEHLEVHAAKAGIALPEIAVEAA